MRNWGWLAAALLLLAGSAASVGACDDANDDDDDSESETSAGTATLEFELPSSKSYCITSDGCSPNNLITVRRPSGEFLALYAGFCPTMCSDCKPQPCPGVACLPIGVEVNGDELTWNGGYFEPGTCDHTVSCTRQRFAQPGRYVAVMCAVPGHVEDDGNADPQCVADGDGSPECVEVEFDFPSKDVVKGTLPG